MVLPAGEAPTRRQALQLATSLAVAPLLAGSAQAAKGESATGSSLMKVPHTAVVWPRNALHLKSVAGVQEWPWQTCRRPFHLPTSRCLCCPRLQAPRASCR